MKFENAAFDNTASLSDTDDLPCDQTTSGALRTERA